MSNRKDNFVISRNKEKKWRKIDIYNHAIGLVLMDFFSFQPVNCYYICPEFSFDSPLNAKKKIYFDFYEKENLSYDDQMKNFWEVFTIPLKELSSKKKNHPFKDLVNLRIKMKLEPVQYEIKEIPQRKKKA